MRSAPAREAPERCPARCEGTPQRRSCNCGEAGERQAARAVRAPTAAGPTTVTGDVTPRTAAAVTGQIVCPWSGARARAGAIGLDSNTFRCDLGEDPAPVGRRRRAHCGGASYIATPGSGASTSLAGLARTADRAGAPRAAHRRRDAECRRAAEHDPMDPVRGGRQFCQVSVISQHGCFVGAASAFAHPVKVSRARWQFKRQPSPYPTR